MSLPYGDGSCRGGPRECVDQWQAGAVNRGDTDGRTPATGAVSPAEEETARHPSEKLLQYRRGSTSCPRAGPSPSTQSSTQRTLSIWRQHRTATDHAHSRPLLPSRQPIVCHTHVPQAVISASAHSASRARLARTVTSHRQHIVPLTLLKLVTEERLVAVVRGRGERSTRNTSLRCPVRQVARSPLWSGRAPPSGMWTFVRRSSFVQLAGRYRRVSGARRWCAQCSSGSPSWSSPPGPRSTRPRQ